MDLFEHVPLMQIKQYSIFRLACKFAGKEIYEIHENQASRMLMILQ